jgi:hypothetical protein
MAAKGQHTTVKLIKDIVPGNNYQTLLTENLTFIVVLVSVVPDAVTELNVTG